MPIAGVDMKYCQVGESEREAVHGFRSQFGQGRHVMGDVYLEYKRTYRRVGNGYYGAVMSSREAGHRRSFCVER